MMPSPDSRLISFSPEKARPTSITHSNEHTNDFSKSVFVIKVFNFHNLSINCLDHLSDSTNSGTHYVPHHHGHITSHIVPVGSPPNSQHGGHLARRPSPPKSADHDELLGKTFIFLPRTAMFTMFCIKMKAFAHLYATIVEFLCCYAN